MDADIAVIGAGAAGLSAARSLAGKSLRVVVLEARDRIGGRVLSHALSRSAIPAELGAEFIHGPAGETRALLREGGMAAIDVGGDSWTCADTGEPRLDDDDFVSAAAIFEQARGLAQDESIDRFLRRFTENGGALDVAGKARAFVEGFEAADPGIASAKAIGDELRSGVDSASARPLNGYGPMVDRLRDACVASGVRIELSTIVRKISRRRGAVNVEVSTPAGGSVSICARAAIVTLPAGVLRHQGDDAEIVFDPVLPAPKRNALLNVEMGQVVRAALWFQSPFWERIRAGRYLDAGFFRSAHGAFSAYWTQLPVRSDLIVAWVGGPKAAALAGCSQAEIVAQACGGFGTLLGEPGLARRELRGGAAHDWNSDPFTRGAYSYLAVGAGDARAILAAPVDDTLFFAGEATAGGGQGGTVNGALGSGERAAREAVRALDARAGAGK